MVKACEDAAAGNMWSCQNKRSWRANAHVTKNTYSPFLAEFYKNKVGLASQPE